MALASLRAHQFYKLAIITIALVNFIYLCAVGGSERSRLLSRLQAFKENRHSNGYEYPWGTHKPLNILGYANNGNPVNSSCKSISYSGVIGIQDGPQLYDNLTEVALLCASHPMVVYDDKFKELMVKNFSSVAEQTWARFSGSSVWLEEYGVYLAITRTIFNNGRSVYSPLMSFLRAQIYDADWNHLDQYTLVWNKTVIVFPRMLDIPADFEEGGWWYGPEDPRVIVQLGVKGAEPVVVFNKVSKKPESIRAMWIHRPFSGHSTILTIRGKDRPGTEKNWAPFFLDSPKDKASPKSKKPAQHINFVYTFSPLQILYCDLWTGDCDLAYIQTLTDGFKHKEKGEESNLRGGTNFMPVPLPGMKTSSNINAWVAVPRTRNMAGCAGAVYRPLLAVMVSIDSEFYLAFASDPIHLGNAIALPREENDGCGTGRIVIPNSIARWDLDEDIMTITFSTDDSTVEVTRATGILAFIQSLPWLQELGEGDIDLTSDRFLRNQEISAVGSQLGICAVQAATREMELIKAMRYYLEEERRKKDKDAERKKKEELEKEEQKKKEEAEKMEKEKLKIEEQKNKDKEVEKKEKEKLGSKEQKNKDEEAKAKI